MERDFQRKLIMFLKKRNAIVFNLIGNVFQRDLPDLYVAHRQWTGWLELKTGNRKVTPGQRVVLDLLKERGVAAYELRLVPDGYELDGTPYTSFEELWKALINE